jgi:hypothetical protein
MGLDEHRDGDQACVVSPGQVSPQRVLGLDIDF